MSGTDEAIKVLDEMIKEYSDIALPAYRKAGEAYQEYTKDPSVGEDVFNRQADIYAETVRVIIALGEARKRISELGSS